MKQELQCGVPRVEFPEFQHESASNDFDAYLAYENQKRLKDIE